MSHLSGATSVWVSTPPSSNVQSPSVQDPGTEHEIDCTWTIGPVGGAGPVKLLSSKYSMSGAWKLENPWLQYTKVAKMTWKWMCMKIFWLFPTCFPDGRVKNRHFNLLGFYYPLGLWNGKSIFSSYHITICWNMSLFKGHMTKPKRYNEHEMGKRSTT